MTEIKKSGIGFDCSFVLYSKKKRVVGFLFRQNFFCFFCVEKIFVRNVLALELFLLLLGQQGQRPQIKVAIMSLNNR